VFGREERHDGRRPDGDVLRAAEDAVHEAAHERRVEAVLKINGLISNLGNCCSGTKEMSSYLIWETAARAHLHFKSLQRNQP
jgi:hypothetical protein